MAQIKAFRALRYNLEKAGKIESLVCPPYDIISESEREGYLKQNPRNIVQLELPVGDDPYGEAAQTLKDFVSSGVMKRDMDDGVYIYEEEFLDKAESGSVKKLRGLIALVRLEDFSSGVILPHEETLSKAKEDRFKLMCATGCNFSPIYCLYKDEKHASKTRLDNLADSTAPRYEFSDGSVTHRLWVANDVNLIEALRQDFAGRKLYIADGHHRYETALRYRDSRREAGDFSPEAGYVMMFLADMDDEGLVVFPTHRLVHGLEGFSEKALLDEARRYFEVSSAESREAAEAALASLYEGSKHAFAFFSGEEWRVLTLSNTAVMDSLLPDKSKAYRGLDVTILHTLILERLLGIDKENMAAQKNLSYTRSAAEAEASVREKKSNCCFLLNPTRVSEISEVAAAGEKMPQKSTYFYPKLITGLVVNPLADIP